MIDALRLIGATYIQLSIRLAAGKQVQNQANSTREEDRIELSQGDQDFYYKYAVRLRIDQRL